MMEHTGFRSAFDKIDRGLVRILKISAYIGAVALMVTMVIAVIDVCMAKFLHSGIPYATEGIQYLNVAIVFFGVGYVQLDMGHTCVDLLWDKLPRGLRFGIKFVSYIVAVAVCIFFGCRTVVLLLQKIQLHTLSGGAVGFQVWPFAAILAWGFFSLALANIWSIVRAIVSPKKYVFHEADTANPSQEAGGAKNEL